MNVLEKAMSAGPCAKSCAKGLDLPWLHDMTLLPAEACGQSEVWFPVPKTWIVRGLSTGPYGTSYGSLSPDPLFC